MRMVVVDPGEPKVTDRCEVTNPSIVTIAVLSLGTAVTVTLVAEVGALTA